MSNVSDLSGWRRRQYRRPRGRGCTEREWQFMCWWYAMRCLACGEKKPLTADHVDPLRYGGSQGIGNLQPLCRECNSAKGATFKDYRPLLDHLKMMDRMRERGILWRI